MEKIHLAITFPFRAVRRMGPKAARALFENGQGPHSYVSISAGTKFDERAQREKQYRPVAHITISSQQGLDYVNQVLSGIRSGRVKPSKPPLW